MADIKHTVRDLRKDYTQESLDEAAVSKNPFEQFELWMQEAVSAKVHEANAMHLATVDAHGRPSGRIVLLRGLDDRGFVFFTNYESKKGRQMAENPFAALTFFWPELERQLRIEGRIEKISGAESDAYFYSRPRGNRLGAWASPQSAVIESREEIDRLTAVLEAKYPGDTPIPRPEHWGGYRVVPELIEFWQGRASRLHDRIQYKQLPQGWMIERLAP